jgi:hypothetical protein
MMIDKNLDYLLDQNRDRMEMLKQALTSGNCQTYEEYKYTCGQLRGLEAACLTIVDLKHRLENSDE